MDRLQEQVSKIEMYKRSMNNNYRKIHLICLFFVNEKQDFSFSVVILWPIPPSMHWVYPYFCLYTLEKTLELDGICLKGALSDVKGDLQEIGNKLWVI